MSTKKVATKTAKAKAKPQGKNFVPSGKTEMPPSFYRDKEMMKKRGKKKIANPNDVLCE